MKKLLLLLLFSLLLLTSCKKNDNSVSSNDNKSTVLAGTWVGNNKPAPHAVDSYTFVFTNSRFTESFNAASGPVTETGGYSLTGTQLTLKYDSEPDPSKWWVVDYTLSGSTLSISNWEGEGYPLVLKKQ